MVIGASKTSLARFATLSVMSCAQIGLVNKLLNGGVARLGRRSEFRMDGWRIAPGYIGLWDASCRKRSPVASDRTTR